MQEYRLYLDNIEFLDIPEQIFKFEKILIRDFSESIFRDKSENEFVFYGDAYNYICSKRKNNICEDISIKIEKKIYNDWYILFIGFIKQINVVVFPKTKLIKAKIYDNSYSAMIREREDNKYFLNLNKSIDGTSIQSAIGTKLQVFNSSGINIRMIQCYEVFECIKYLVRILTNNKLQVVSDIFTIGVLSNKYCITTGAMLRLGIGGGAINNSFQNTYLVPEISYKELFNELRKCFKLFTAIEYDLSGNALLRIENEDFFYKNNVIKNIDYLPDGFEEDIIEDNIYSEIKIGSTKSIPDTTYYVPTIRLYSWQEETYNNCTNCNVQNTLDLVNDWVIDSNLIHEAIDGNDVWDKDIFILELENINTIKKYQEAVDILPNLDGIQAYYYNESLNNYNKLINWNGGIPECVANFYNQEKCNESIYDTADDIKIQHSDSFTGFVHLGISYTILRYAIENCDSIFIQNNDYSSQNCDILDFSPFPALVPLVNNTTGTGTLIQIPFTGQYQFECQVNVSNLLQVGGGSNIGPLEEYKIELKILRFDNGFQGIESGGNETPTAYTDTYIHSGNFEDNFNINLNVITPLLNLTAGCVIVPTIRIRTVKLGIGVNSGDALQVNSGYFNILQQNYEFISDTPILSDKQISIRYKFKYPICFEEYLKIEKNKYSIIKVNNFNSWIKEIKYIDNLVSELTLISNDIMCEQCSTP